ncbi:3-hydroxyacyl-ACP dehydratase FabZ family protein [Novipirellula artificiosorum]|uniref:3-hydroxyacyl-[acyl-carrier-protein] dehydratase FabZ n=1 Tax=Novipirellula artificiosorum TaxID=2528016 RepID=A0A5C6DZQ2_9BACT|nr:3-hydroxyacyl-ACP dehydratase FabZ family protein [Novipirellula artificiosorum]TWU42913.1 3-hydroxyacyl-[acyl-carrier-protein] dehydratase FabZ [Novipirellula artificiosorum]
MRWFWVDRFTEFVSGSHAYGIKNVTLDEAVVDEYQPGYPMLPPTLVIEGMAQLGGILVSEHFAFEKRCVLAKVGKALFHRPALPGDQLVYRVTMESVHETGATVTSTSHIGDARHAEIDLMFAFLEEGRFTDGPLFGPGDLEAMLRLMHFFHVAVDASGNPIPKYPNL